MQSPALRMETGHGGCPEIFHLEEQVTSPGEYYRRCKCRYGNAGQCKGKGRITSKHRFFQGDCSDENTLKKADVPSAPEIFVLADESKPDASVFDIDSRTINTVGTVLSLIRDARICVEIIDERFKPLLTDPRIDAVICTNERARQVPGRTFITPGFSKIINHMIESQNGGQLRTVQFPSEYVGRSFETLSSYFNESSGATLIGLVENAEKYRELKNEAVRDAPKTSSMTRIPRWSLLLQHQSIPIPHWSNTSPAG